MSTKTVPERLQGSNPFPFGSPFLDTLSRLGFADMAVAAELESFWWFMGPEGITPDDLAGAVMVHLPNETDKEASLRRMGIDAEFHHQVKELPVIRRKRKGTGTK